MSEPNGGRKGLLASAKGFANESRLLAALLERGFNASRVDLPHSTYDIVVEKSTHDIIRVQVKTVGKKGSVSFRGGVRGGADRTYKSDVKSYTHNTETCDIVVGVESLSDNGDKEVNFYFIPTLHIEKIGQKSLSVNRIPQAKNNWEILRMCKDSEFVKKEFG
jgi:hypothetical protein